ncbi:glycosyltransferase [Clostridium hydrogeniformans]|uniref:glycosyltransferase n=1 Tax=Clostridium hydrogeniformans TaxID=349933 RepID=UPI0004875E35|nr:glycosyltransferase [Clostridium hydrogeniformans]
MRILVISNQLPPFTGSGNIRVMNYINYLCRLGNKIDVITVEYPKDCIAYDQSLEDVFIDGVNLYRVRNMKFYKYFYQKKPIETGKSNRTISSKIKIRISKFIKHNFVIPDEYMFWINNAFKKSQELMSKNSYDIILSIHERPSSHLVALKLKNKYPNVKWVGYWSDPWNEDSLRKNRGIIKATIEEMLEKKVVEKVDRLLFTTNKTLALYERKFNIDKEKLDIVYRGYNLDEYVKNKGIRNRLNYIKPDKFNIIHTGVMYSDLRDITPLVNALNILKIKYEEIYSKINIIFIGFFTDYNDKCMLNKFECIEIHDPIPFKEVIKYIENADTLLLYGNKNSTQVPGKVFEYIGSEAPILTILGDEKDELRDFMKNIDKGPVILNDEKELILGIKELFKENKKWKRRIEQYEWENVVKDLEIKLKS